MAKGVTTNYIVCIDCGKKVAVNNERAVADNFYRVSERNKKHYNKNTEVYKLCKLCMKKQCYDDAKFKVFNKAKFMYVLKNVMNRPYVHDYFEKTLKQCKDKPQNIFTTYMRKICIVGVFDKVWEDGDTLFENEKLITNEKQEETIETHNTITSMSIEDDFVVTKDMIRKWGKGYEPEDYEFLEESFKKWIANYKNDTPAEIKTFEFLALKELEIRKGREEDKNVDKLEETYLKLMNTANVTPRDANASNDPENMSCFGMWVKDIESKRPAEHFKDKSIYNDFDNIGEYLERFVFRPLKNLLTGSRDFDKEFSVETIMDEEESED